MAHISRERRVNLQDPGIQDDVRFLRFLGDDLLAQGGGEWAPPMDVLEHVDGVEVVVDLPGVADADLRVFFSHGALVIAGRKVPAACSDRGAAFHLAERSFGRFARVIRLNGAFDAGRAAAVLTAGELRVRLPRIDERRGRDIPIAIARS